MPLGPRYYDPANRVSPFAAAVGSAISGYTDVQDYIQKRKQQTQADEDRQREINREAKSDAVRDYEAGVRTAPTGAPTHRSTPMDEDPSGTPAPVFSEQPTVPASPAIGGGDVASQPDTSFGAAVGQALGRQSLGGVGASTDASQGPATARPVPPISAAAPVMSTQPQAVQGGGGIRAAVGSVLGRIGSNLSTGGYTPQPTPTYTATRVGPSEKERVEGVRETGENAREGVRAGAQLNVAAGNNRTAIQVANINADSRQAVATAKAAADTRAKLSMQAVNNQLQNTDRAIAQLEKDYDKAEPGLTDNTAARTDKKSRQGRIQTQIDRLRQQRGNLAQQQQTMMLGMAMGVSDFSGLLPQPQSMSDPNDESQMSDADLWEKKKADGMTAEQATAYVRQRKRGP